jgi:hypothetical protein
MDRRQQVRYSYLVAVAGVALATINAAYGAVRTALVRETFRGGFNGTRQFRNATPFAPFPLTSSLTIVAVIIALVGLVWLGLALRKSHESTTDKPSLTEA